MFRRSLSDGENIGISNQKVEKLIKNPGVEKSQHQSQARYGTSLSAVQDYKKQLVEQRAKLRELFDSVLHKSISSK